MTLVEASFLIKLLLRGTSSGRNVGIRLAGSSLAIVAVGIVHGDVDGGVIRTAHRGRIAPIRYLLKTLGGAIGRRTLGSRHWLLRESEFGYNRCSMTFDEHAWLNREYVAKVSPLKSAIGLVR